MLYPTYLFRRGDTFYYRAKVPTDLKDQVNRHKVWISLRTSDRQKAELQLAETHVQQLRTYDCLRQGLPAPSRGNFVTKTAFEPIKTASEASIDDLLSCYMFWFNAVLQTFCCNDEFLTVKRTPEFHETRCTDYARNNSVDANACAS
jgi:hypothetical protein